MLNKIFSRDDKLKNYISIILTVIILLLIFVIVITEIVRSHPDSMQKAVTQSFNNIKTQLEFEGVGDAAKGFTREYGKLFNGYSNIIITDDSGKVLYSLNPGYLSEKNHFTAVVNPWSSNNLGSSMVYILDSKNNIRYSAQLGSSFNMNHLKEKSSRNSLSEKLFSKSTDYEDETIENKIINSDGSYYVLSDDTRLIVDYGYIASKELHLFALYDADHQMNDYFQFEKDLHMVRHWLILAIAALAAVLWILLPVWVFKNAKSYRRDARFWSIITFITSIIGFVLYLILRGEYKNSGTKAAESIICPNCGQIIPIQPAKKNR